MNLWWLGCCLSACYYNSTVVCLTLVSQVETYNLIFRLQKGFCRLSIIVIRKKGMGQNLNQKLESVMKISIFWQPCAHCSATTGFSFKFAVFARTHQQQKNSKAKKCLLISRRCTLLFFLWTHERNLPHILMIQVNSLLFNKCTNNDFLLGSAKTQVTYT